MEEDTCLIHKTKKLRKVKLMGVEVFLCGDCFRSNTIAKAIAEKRRVEVGIDGNCGYALLGENLQEGECEFVEIKENYVGNYPLTRNENERVAWWEAYKALCNRLGIGKLSYYIKT